MSKYTLKLFIKRKQIISLKKAHDEHPSLDIAKELKQLVEKADESLHDIRQQLENTLNKLGLFFNNQFLLTPNEWNGHSNLFSE